MTRSSPSARRSWSPWLFARVGRRYGLPTIPLFMIAGIVFGPSTPGLDLVHDPGDLRLVATLGLVLLLFYLGLEFSVGDLVEGGSRLSRSAPSTWP